MLGNVLVVDDDHAVCDVIREALYDSGFDVECVTTDRDAYARISNLPTLDGLVLDIGLGRGVTGFDIARFARQVIRDVAVVYVSGAVPHSSHTAFGVPESYFIQKPFEPDELVAAMTVKLCARALGGPVGPIGS